MKMLNLREVKEFGHSLRYSEWWRLDLNLAGSQWKRAGTLKSKQLKETSLDLNRCQQQRCARCVAIGPDQFQYIHHYPQVSRNKDWRQKQTQNQQERTNVSKHVERRNGDLPQRCRGSHRGKPENTHSALLLCSHPCQSPQPIPTGKSE